jgi:hypothetical protein
MKEHNTWHSKLGRVHHNNDHCRSGHSMRVSVTESGWGGKPLCRECAGLAARGVPRIMKDWDKTSDGRTHSTLLSQNAKRPLSQYPR